MSRMIDKAELELDLFLEHEPDVDKSIKGKVLEMLELFSSQGHSGMSAGATIALFKTQSEEQLKENGYFDKDGGLYGDMLGKAVKELLDKFIGQDYGDTLQRKLAQDIFVTLAKQENILPITCDDKEWGDVSQFGSDPTYQNKRLSSVFKKDKEGKPYYLDAIVWKNQTGGCYTGGAFLGEERYTSRQYIKLPFTPRTFYIDVIEAEDQPTQIKHQSQLKEVFEYYEKFN